jgi:serine protease
VIAILLVATTMVAATITVESDSDDIDASTIIDGEYMLYVQQALSTAELNMMESLGLPIVQHYVSETTEQTIIKLCYQDGNGGVASSGASVLTVQAHLVTVLGTQAAGSLIVAASRDRIVKASGSAGNWALDRIDERDLPLDSNYEPHGDGSGRHVYVVDTGIDVAHSQFGGRASNAYSVVNNGDFTPCDGHGTHVAGIIGSQTYGTAKAVNMHSVRVLDCNGSGTLSGLAQALLWILDHHVPSASVVNMSLGFYGSDATIASLIAQLVADNVVVVAAAGNDDVSACSHFPSAYAGVVSVGASDSSDRRAGYSNWGTTCADSNLHGVTLFAPGSSITSTWPNGDTHSMSGTSMAAPLVSGAAAMLLQQDSSAASVRLSLAQAASANKLSGVKGAPNKLLYVAEQDSDSSASAAATTGAAAATAGGASDPSSSKAAMATAATTLMLLLLMIGVVYF